MEFLNSSNFEILKQGNESTLCRGIRQEVIVISLVFFRLLERITVWEIPL
jgi:hypothetical protein